MIGKPGLKVCENQRDHYSLFDDPAYYGGNPGRGITDIIEKLFFVIVLKLFL